MMTSRFTRATLSLGVYHPTHQQPFRSELKVRVKHMAASKAIFFDHTRHLQHPCCRPLAPCTTMTCIAGDRLKRLIRKPFQELPNTSVGLRTKNLKKFVGYTRRRCWKECLSNYDCQSVLHLLGTEPKECYLLDSIAEHRLISIPEEMKGMLLYSNNRREMEMPPLGWNDTITGLGAPRACPPAWIAV